MLNKEQKIEIIENAVKEYFGVKKVNLLMILKNLNVKGVFNSNLNVTNL